MTLGHLGIHRVTTNSPTDYLPQSYTHRLWIALTAANSALREDIRARLEQDPRAKKLVGRMLNNGFGASLLNLDSIVYWWIWRANNVGTTQADSELERFLASEETEIFICLWLHGIDPKTTVKLTEQIDLVPTASMPDSDEKEEYVAAFNLSLSAIVPKPRAALITKVRIPKIVSNIYDPSDNENCQRAIRLLFQTATLLNCLPDVYCLPYFRTTYLPEYSPPGPFSGKSGITPIYDTIPSNYSTPDVIDPELVNSLIIAFEKLPQTSQQTLNASLLRLGQAKFRQNPNDSALDLGISLEMLLLNSEHKGQELPGQLNLHFRIRGAWLIGDSPTDRRRVYDLLGRIYKFRSQVAHNGRSTDLARFNLQELKAMKTEHLAVACKIVQEIITKGFPKNWADLVVGPVVGTVA